MGQTRRKSERRGIGRSAGEIAQGTKFKSVTVECDSRSFDLQTRRQPALSCFELFY